MTDAAPAGLQYNVNGTWELETPYAQENVTAADEEWMAMDISEAFVALTREHAEQLGLPRSLPFPWDNQRKDLYLISSIHSIHCLVRRSDSLQKARANRGTDSLPSVQPGIPHQSYANVFNGTYPSLFGQPSCRHPVQRR